MENSIDRARRYTQNHWLLSKVFGITLLGWLNLLVFQWLFVGLYLEWYIRLGQDENGNTVPVTHVVVVIAGPVLPILMTKPWDDKVKIRVSKIKTYIGE